MSNLSWIPLYIFCNLTLIYLIPMMETKTFNFFKVFQTNHQNNKKWQW